MPDLQIQKNWNGSCSLNTDEILAENGESLEIDSSQSVMTIQGLCLLMYQPSFCKINNGIAVLRVPYFLTSLVIVVSKVTDSLTDDISKMAIMFVSVSTMHLRPLRCPERTET